MSQVRKKLSSATNRKFCHDRGMSTEPDISEEEKAVLDERLKTSDEDAKDAQDARKVLTELRDKLRNKQPAPR